MRNSNNSNNNFNNFKKIINFFSMIFSIIGIFGGIFLIAQAQDLKSPLYQIRDLIINLQPISEEEKFIKKNIDQAIEKGLKFLDPKKYLTLKTGKMDQTEWTIFKVLATNFLDDRPKLKNEIIKIYRDEIFSANHNYPEKFRWEFVFWDKGYSIKEFPYVQAVVYDQFLQSSLSKRSEITPRTELFMRTLFCQEVPFKKEMLDYTIYELPKLDNFRYELTHALMILQFAKERNCFDQKEIKKGMDILALKIKEETPKVLEAISQEKIDSLNLYDIFAEMVAFLLLADYPQYVEAKWLKEIIERQNPDGGWKIRGFKNEGSSSHGTVVSLLTLLPYKNYYLAKKPNNFGWLKEIKIKENLALSQKISPNVLKKLEKNPTAKLIVKYKKESDLPKISQKIKKSLTKIKPNHLVAKLSLSEVNFIKDDPTIEFIALDYEVKADLIESLEKIDYFDFKEKYPLSGKNIKLCLVDSGVDLNEFSYVAGYDFVNEDEVPEDEHGHGTLMASIIKKIAPDVQLLVAKVLDKNGSGFSSNLLRAFDFCKQNKAKIINLSLGGGSFDGFCDAEPAAEAANKLFLENNIFIVASAGNNGLNNELSMPACASQVFSVGSVNKNDEVSHFSNRAAFLDMFAPGENIKINDKFYSGTSFSTPFVSSASALLFEKEPEISIFDLKNRLKYTGDGISYFFSTDKISLNSQVFSIYNNQMIQIPRLNILNFIQSKKVIEPYDYSWYWQAEGTKLIGLIGMNVGSQEISTDPVINGGGNFPPTLNSWTRYRANCTTSLYGTCPGTSCFSGSQVCFSGSLSDDGNQARLEVEYTTGTFSNTPNATSSYCNVPCTATVTSGTLTNGSQYKAQARAFDGSSPSSWNQCNSGNVCFVADTTFNSCSISSITESSTQSYVSGTTLYYNNNSGTANFTVNVSASDSGSGVEKVNFPNTVSNGGDDTTSPYSVTYTWDSADTYSQATNATCYDNVGNSAQASFSVIRDITAPTSVSISYTNGYITTTTNQITFSASDSQSGIASFTLYYRQATLSNNTCGTFGAWTSLGNQTSPFNHTVSSGNCYQYYVTATNNAGLSSSTSQTPTATTKVDTSAPITGSINDGTGTDIDEQTNTTSTSANWSGFSDAESSLRQTNTYEYSFRRQSDNYFWNGTSWQASSFTFFTTATSTTLSGLVLVPNVVYYFQVRAYNNANTPSNFISSDGFTVTPSISFSLSANFINLGTLSLTTVSAGSITTTTSTNSANGYVTTIYTDGNLRTTTGINFSYINDNNNVTSGSGKYGVATSKAEQAVAQYSGSCTSGSSVGPMSGSPTISNATTSSSAVSIASSSGPVSNDTTTLCFAISPSALTPAGTYSQIITITTTGKF